MGNTASERVHGWGHGDRHRRDSPKAKEDHRSNILIDSSEDADLFHADDPKGPESQEFFAWQQDLESDIKSPSQNRPTMFRWTGGGKDVYLSGSFNNWATKIPLSRSQSNFVAVLDLPEGEHQYKYYVDGQWTLDHKEVRVKICCKTRPLQDLSALCAMLCRVLHTIRYKDLLFLSTVKFSMCHNPNTCIVSSL